MDRSLSKRLIFVAETQVLEQSASFNMSLLPEEFDIIVCGGGSCGCVVAGRYGPWPRDCCC